MLNLLVHRMHNIQNAALWVLGIRSLDRVINKHFEKTKN